jgi:hypothetical protein
MANQDLMVAALQGVVNKFDPRGRRWAMLPSALLSNTPKTGIWLVKA